MPYTVIFGDVHLDSEQCLQTEFKEALSSLAQQVDLIIFNGDFLDSYGAKGKKALKEFLSWADKKGIKEKMIFITGGMGHEGNVLYDQPEIQILPYAILTTAEGRIIICHGHNIGLVKQINETWVQAARKVKKQLVEKGSNFLPKILQTDILILSHTHAPFYDMDYGVFATGSWKLKEELQDKKEYIQRNIGVFIVIDDEDRDDPIKLQRWLEK